MVHPLNLGTLFDFAVMSPKGPTAYDLLNASYGITTGPRYTGNDEQYNGDQPDGN